MLCMARFCDYVTEGMPEAVLCRIDTNDLEDAML